MLRRHGAGDNKRGCKSKPLKPETHLFHPGVVHVSEFQSVSGKHSSLQRCEVELLPLKAHLGLSARRPATGSVGLTAALQAELFIAPIGLSDRWVTGHRQPLPPAQGKTKDARSTCWMDTSKHRGEEGQSKGSRVGACPVQSPGRFQTWALQEA